MISAKRFIAMLLMIIMLSATVADPLSLIVYAGGPQVATLGATDVSDTPDELLTLGEWQYYIENDVAVIAGYTNYGETSLTLPYSLGGYPVAGIAHRAFSANTALEEIEIHTNVTSIAVDAFEDCNNLAISAYNGAYALVYAEECGYRANNISTAAEFVEGAIDLTGLNAKSYSSLCDDSVVFKINEAGFLAEGQVLYFPVSKGYDTGLARRVESISYTDAGIYVTLSEVAFGEVFEAYEAESELRLDWDHAIYPEGVYPVDDEVDAEGLFSGTYENEFTRPKTSESHSFVFTASKNNRTHMVDISFTIETSGKIYYKLHRSGLSFKWEAGQIEFTETTTWAFAYTEKIDLSKQSDGQRRNSWPYWDNKDDVKTQEIMVPFVSIVGVTGYFVLEIVAEVNGTFRITHKATEYIHGEVKNGKWEIGHDSYPGYHTIELECTVKVGPRFKIEVDVGIAKIVEMEVFEGYLWVYLQITGNSRTQAVTGTVSWHNCVDISAKIFVEVGMKLGFVKVKSLIGKLDIGVFASLSKKMELKSFPNVHWDFSGFDSIQAPGISSCDLKNRTAVFDDGYQNIYEINNETVNSGIICPEVSREGYKLEGWYLDADKSGLEGEDYKVIPLTTRMPFIGTDGTAYFYAKWIDLYPPESITLNKTSYTCYSDKGKTLKLGVLEWVPARTNNKGLKWSSSDPEVAAVDSNGAVALKRAGTATITAECVIDPSVNASCEVTIRQSVTGVTLDKHYITKFTDEFVPVKLSAAVSPDDAYDSTVIWTSSDNDVAEVDDDGNVTLKGAGKAEIWCTSKTNPDVADVFNVNLLQAVTGLTLDKSSLFITTADMSAVKLNETVIPADAYDSSVIWTSSDTSVARVSRDGTVTPVGTGTAVITCRSVNRPGFSAECEVTIVKAVTDITLNEKSVTKYSDEKNVIQLTADVKPDNADIKAVRWESSNTDVVRVNESGAVTVIAAGTAVVTCSSVSNPEVTAKCAFNILQAVTSISLRNNSFSCEDDEINLLYPGATVFPADAYNSSLSWQSSDPDVAAVTQDGAVSIVGPGTAVITCSSVSNPYIYAECSVSVAQSVRSMSLNKTNIYCYSGNTEGIQLIADIEGSDSANRSVSWSSSDPAVARIGADGIVYIQSVGECVITAVSMVNSDISACCTVHVMQSVTAVELDRSSIIRDTKHLDPVQLNAAVAPTDAANKTLLWSSSNEAVAIVSQEGVLEFVGPGTCTISCISVTDPEVTAECVVEVKQNVTDIRLNYSSLGVYSDLSEEIPLTAYVYPSYAYNTDVEWSSSDNAVAVVSEDGRLSITGPGSAVIRCASVGDPNTFAECTVAVKQAISALSFDSTEITAFIGSDDISMNVSLSPAGADPADIIWTSTDTGVVTVNGNGDVAVSGLGSAFIRAASSTDPDVYAECRFDVYKPVNSIILNSGNITCYSDMGFLTQLSANVQPVGTENRDVVWSSSRSSAAAVSDNGTVTVTGAGKAVISCTSVSNPEISAKITVNVKQGMTSVVLDSQELKLYGDEEGALINAAVLPSGTSDSALIWESSNRTVAAVGDSGFVTPVSAGTAVISCRSARRPDAIYAECTVTVLQRTEGVEIESSRSSLLPGETTALLAKVYPQTADNKAVIWSSSDPTIASVDADGNVTGVSYGKVLITAAAADGSGAEAGYAISVERELDIEATIDNDTLYVFGDEPVTIATIFATDGSVRRMSESGTELIWTLADNAEEEVSLSTRTITIEVGGEEYRSVYAVLTSGSFTSEGDRSYTVTCTAGDYEATETISVKVLGGEYSDKATLSPSSFYIDIGEKVEIPYAPLSTDGKLIPDGTKFSRFEKDADFSAHAAVALCYDNAEVSFDESGVYTAEAIYSCGNIEYSVPLSFYVRDENGIVRLKTERIELNKSDESLIQGETLKLEAAVSPTDAYAPGLTWSSSDESVATVDENGLVTAVDYGIAYIICSANDGSEVYTQCLVRVERFVQLDESEVSFTVYTGGDEHAGLGIINTTRMTDKRVYGAGMNLTWSLEKLSGDSCEIGIEEFRAEAEEGVTVSGNFFKLLRINGEGSTDYRLVCSSGNYSDTAIIHINVVEAELPNRIAAAKSLYTGAVGETISIDTSYIGGTLPEDTEVRLSFGHAFENALSEDYDSFDEMNLIFARGGSFTAELVYSGCNYSYTCPIAITVSNEDGIVPETITDVNISKQFVYLAAGEQETVTGSIEPEGTAHSDGVWSTTNSSVASVSADGTITAISAGEAYIKYSVPESDIVAGCYVVVEDGLTLEQDAIERTVYVDGITRIELDHVSLTSGSSIRAEEAPVWTLARVSGNNLTLKVKDYGSYDSDGNYIYGCSIVLYSLSRSGDTEYELTCTSGDDSVTIPVTVHAVERSAELPSGVTIGKNTFTGMPGQLISFIPGRVCLPLGTNMPDGIRVTIEGDKVFSESLNASDYNVSQSLVTLSFSRAGLFEADLVFSYSNVRYVVPVIFKIRDESGNVPVLPSSVELSSKSLWLTAGETAELRAIFTPANADNCSVTWTSTDETVASVDANGRVTALRNGSAEIKCVPDDPYLSSKTCFIHVEDYLSLETAPEDITLYKQGGQKNEVFSALLTTGTILRLDEEGITPEWSFSRVSGSNANVSTSTSASGDAFILSSESLNTAGTDVYRITCKAGEYIKSMEISLTVIDSADAPEYIDPTQARVSAAVGETFTVDFTPVCYPTGSQIPWEAYLISGYAGLGKSFFEASDRSVYSEDEDTVTMRFTKPGRYLLARYFLAENLLYSEVCEITVGDSESSWGLIGADSTEVTVYTGGGAGTLVKLNILDSTVFDVFGSDITWTAECISGSSLKAVVKQTATGAELNVSQITGTGTDIWRVTCSMGDYTESVDIKVDVLEPRRPVPESIIPAVNSINGMTGDWLSMPIAVSCEPAGTALPDSGDSFWSFEPLGMAADVSSCKVEDGLLKVLFMYPGYYSGVLHYSAGSFDYSFPVYISITDEEGVLNTPALTMNLIGCAEAVYSGGKTGVSIGTAAVGRGPGEYYMGEAASYMSDGRGEWSITVDSGTAAKLSIKPTENNLAQIVLDSISGTGTIGYTVSCTVDSNTYSESAELTVTNSEAITIDPTLRRRVYYARPGELLTIDTTAYDRSSGSILQSVCSWNPGELAEVIGNEYTMTNEALLLAFYQEGTYVSTVTAVIGNREYSIPFTVVISRTADSGAKLLKLPAALTAIEAYAFENCSAEIADLRGTAAVSIGDGAFSGCTDLKLVFIPVSVTSIASSAFYGCINLTIVCDRGSAADEFAAAHSIPVCYN